MTVSYNAFKNTVINTQEQKQYHTQVCRDLFNQYKAEVDSFLDLITNDDRT